MTDVETRLRRLEDSRLLDDGDLPALVDLFTGDGEFVGLSRARGQVRSFLWQPCVVHGEPHVAGGRYHDDLVRVGGCWRYRRKRVVFDYFAPAAPGWDHGRCTLDAARATREVIA